MPIYMDLHIVPGVKAQAVAEAHQLDVQVQMEHNCNCMTYWVDEKRGNIFCLIEAPNQEAVEAMHRQAHGLVPHRIIEVNTGLVEAFLGRISDPADVILTDGGLRVFNDASFRIILLVQVQDPVLLLHHLGREEAHELTQACSNDIRQSVVSNNGSPAAYNGHGYLASFFSANAAVNCALEIQKKLAGNVGEKAAVKIAVHAGMPVTENEQLFGTVIQQAEQLCTVAGINKVAVSEAVQELLHHDCLESNRAYLYSLASNDENWLNDLYKVVDANWNDAEFTIADYAMAMAMSQPNFYRKMMALTGMAPNVFIKDYRLRMAKHLLKKQHCNIAQVTFETGFSSPSYFTKCFKNRYGLLPNTYTSLLH
ncbi:MAG TPA: DUF4242 domain-containing protein [Ferruginibacter sp.]|nr:DUF4242 domain-containing protein [Ferruginibacter sp.]HMP21237.1 DUF4242 domain-containing protein [Ferruginibacter sp.]